MVWNLFLPWMSSSLFLSRQTCMDNGVRKRASVHQTMPFSHVNRTLRVFFLFSWLSLNRSKIFLRSSNIASSRAESLKYIASFLCVWELRKKEPFLYSLRRHDRLIDLQRDRQYSRLIFNGFGKRCECFSGFSIFIRKFLASLWYQRSTPFLCQV